MGSLDILALAPAPDAAVAVVSEHGRTLDYGRLRYETTALAALLDRPHKALVAIEDPRRLDGLRAYLAALRCGHAVLLVEAGTARLWRRLVDTFRPDVVIARDHGIAPEILAGDYTPGPGAGGTIWSRAGASGPIHPDLAILVRTSGSIGHPRAVRLSYDNLRSNAVAVAQALGLGRTDLTVTSLPLDFIFGLSLVNSGLIAGGAVAVSPLSPSTGHFWATLDRVAATVVGATPVTYTALRALRWDGRSHPSLRLLLHAGGPLDEVTLRYFQQAMDRGRPRFVSMYGQTEASGRVCCQRVRPALDDVATVGAAIPGTVVTIEAPDGTAVADGEPGEIVVRGPGVMMGYARGRADLSLGDTQGGRLRTGDVGHRAAGRYYVTGRLDRQVKVLGRRIQLDDVERLMLRRGIEAAVDLGADGRLVVAGVGCAGVSEACAEVAVELGIPRAAMTWVSADQVVHRPNGKLDRRATFERVAAGGDRHARH